ncbi:MAG: DUF4332 domain-containing protein [Anaerolineae bacterium]|nr:DUF4332 domain-containing protein [Anaerolineae bacterium]
MIQRNNPARPIAWLILVLGIIGVLVALVAGNEERFASFLVSQILIAGIIFIIVGIILLLVLQPIEIPMVTVKSSAASAAPPTPPVKPTSPAPVAAKPASAAPVAAKPVDPARPAQPDDLTMIEGIGPKSAQALYDSGVTTFAQVAQMSPEELHRIVKVEANVKIVGEATRTWPKQAQYIVRGDMDGLKDFQQYLISGRDPSQYKD